MVNRRLLLFAALLLFLGSIAGALSPREDSGTARPAAAADPAASQPVRATLPRPGPVLAQVGDLVALRVRSETADQAEIAGFGLSEAVDKDLVAELTFVADRPGRFPVQLSLAGREVGSLIVRER